MDLGTLAGVVKQDMQRVLRYREYCRAQEALLKSKMQLGAGKTHSDDFSGTCYFHGGLWT